MRLAILISAIAAWIVSFLATAPWGPRGLLAGELNGFDLRGALIPQEEILPGGPPRDGIPAIDKPRFVSATEALRLYPKGTRAIVVRGKSEVKAYPVPVMNWHEIVNDRIGKTPVAVTYCPLCGTGIVFKSEVDSEVLNFGVSGLLYQSDMLLYDRKTESLWSQLLRKAVAGKYKGWTLEVYPSRIELLHEVAKKDRSTRVLSTKTGFLRDYKRNPYEGYDRSTALYFPVGHRDDKAPLKAWSLLLHGQEKSLIVPLPHLDPKKREVKLRIGGKQVLIQYDHEKNLLNCKGKVDGVECLPGYYFALRAFYPEAKLYAAQSGGKNSRK